MPDVVRRLQNGNAAVIREDGSYFEIDPQGSVIEKTSGMGEPSLAKKTLDTTVEGLSYPMGFPANPFRIAKPVSSGDVSKSYYELMPQQEKAGAMVKEEAGNILGDIPSNSMVGGALKFGVNMIPFEPSSLVLPALSKTTNLIRGLVPPTAIAGRYGKALVENRIPSSAKEIRHAERYGGKDAADLVIERPQLGNSRSAIKENSIKGIEDIEVQVQKKLDETSEAARKGAGKDVKIEGTPLLPPPGEKQAINPSSPSVEFPLGSSRPRKVHEPEIVSLPGKDMETLDPYAMSAQESGRGQTFGGRFFGGEPKIDKAQAEMVKQARTETIEQMASLKLPPPPKYGFKIPNKLAIGRDEFSHVFDDLIKKESRIPTRQNVVEELKNLKDEYVKTAPEVADVNYWNGVKRDIYQILGDNAFISDMTSAKKLILKRFALSISDKVGERVDGLRELNREQGALLEIRDSIIDSSPKEVKDLTLTGPILERATIMGGRFLGKGRRSPRLPQTPALGVPSLRGDR